MALNRLPSCLCGLHNIRSSERHETRSLTMTWWNEIMLQRMICCVFAWSVASWVTTMCDGYVVMTVTGVRPPTGQSSFTTSSSILYFFYGLLLFLVLVFILWHTAFVDGWMDSNDYTLTPSPQLHAILQHSSPIYSCRFMGRLRFIRCRSLPTQ